MSEKGKRIGICGGTFDPVHHGHLISAECIRHQYKLDRIIFIPTGMPPHKKLINVTDAEHRFNMLCRAIETNPFFSVSRIEIERPGFTYTVDTLNQMMREFDDETKLFYIIGADVVHDLLTWKEYKKVFALCEFIAALRPGYKKQDFEEAAQNLRLNYKARIHLAKIPLIEISSTLVRERVKNNESIKYLVPEGVEEYIAEHGLYKD